jgi:hypothetical protein
MEMRHWMNHGPETRQATVSPQRSSSCDLLGAQVQTCDAASTRVTLAVLSKEETLALLAYKCLNGMALPYLACDFHRIAKTEGRQRLR